MNNGDTDMESWEEAEAIIKVINYTRDEIVESCSYIEEMLDELRNISYEMQMLCCLNGFEGEVLIPLRELIYVTDEFLKRKRRELINIMPIAPPPFLCEKEHDGVY